jgi:SPX domain protein involved in polyphosphate accumulation
MEITKDKLHFRRFEFKYLLDSELRKQIESELSHFVSFDPFVANTPNNQYFVRSLYFDDANFTAFYDKTDGLLNRKKFRLRTYCRSPGDNAPVFLEIKGRYNNLVVKHRTPLDCKSELVTESGEALNSKIISAAASGPVLEHFEYETFKKRIRPNVLIDYQRRPYISKYDAEFRLTFDDQLRATATNFLWPDSGRKSRDVVSGYSVMEVKFRYHMPSWFHRIIQSYDLNRVSISKIVAGVKVLGLAEDLS